MAYPDGSTAPDAAPTRADRAAETAHGAAKCARDALLVRARGIANAAAFDWKISVRDIAPDLWPTDSWRELAELIEDTLTDYLVGPPNPDSASEQARLDAQWDYKEREDD